MVKIGNKKMLQKIIPNLCLVSALPNDEVTTIYNSQSDIIYTNISNSNGNVYYTHYSDHYPIYLQLRI